MTIAKNVEDFRIALLMRVPFYGEIVNRIPFFEDDSIPTACTDGRSVRYNSSYFEKLTLPQQRFVLLHEVFHILLGHCKRPREPRPRLWNAALDMVVNIMLVSTESSFWHMGIEIECPPNAIYVRGLSSRSAEGHYADLLKLNSKESEDAIVFFKRRTYGYGSFEDEVYWAPAPDDLPEPSEVENNSEKVRKLIQQALQNDENKSLYGWGEDAVPEEIRNLGLVRPRNWKRIFKDLLQECEEKNGASWATPKRKYLHTDPPIPGHCRGENDARGEIWMFIDRSGVVSAEELNRFLSEAGRILRDFHTTINFVYWDRQVTDVYRNIESLENFKDYLPSLLGDTDINCVYDYIQSHGLRPDVLLILTDGEFIGLKDASALRFLREKTVLVLSKGQINLAPFKMYGKIASL